MQVISLSVVVLCLSLATSTLYETNGKDVVILRGERDRFTNVVGCSESNAAVCSDENCTYCQCMVDQTFIQTRGQYGKCVSNELMVYATSYEDSFLLENYFHKLCLYQKPRNTKYTFVLGSLACNDNWNSRWIWTNFGQLLNWQTLECMTDDYRAPQNQYFVTMEKCDRNNWKQLWECVGDKKYKIKQTQSGRYMYYGEYSYVTSTWFYASIWTRFGSEKDVCSQAVGCEKFADSSSLLILDKTKCEEQSECLGEKEVSLSKTKCFLLPNKTQYLHNDTWKALEIKNGSFTFTMDKVSLQWDLSKTPKSWGGLLVKVQFKCEDSGAAAVGRNEHCVVIKYTGTFKGFHDDGNDDDDGDNDGDDKTDADQKSNGDDKDNTQTIIIIVCVLVVLLLTGVIVFIIYRYRNRFVCSGRRNTERQDPPPKEEYANAMNPLYPANNNYSGQRECELYESTPDHVYQYVDVDHKTAGPPPQNLTYDYAVIDGPLTKSERSSVELDATVGKGTTGVDEGHDTEDQIGETKDRTQSTKPPPHKYHVLEEP